MDPAVLHPSPPATDPLSILGWRDFPEACHLRLDLIDPNPDQPRRTLDGIEELAGHIAKHGVLQPIVVTYAPQGRYTLVAGHRRVAAVRWLAEHDQYPDRWRDVPAVVRTVAVADRLTLALAENLSRHALSDAEVATAIRVLVDLHGWNQTQIARRLGVSHQWINQFTRVLADPDLAAHVQTGRLSVAKAYQIQRAPSPDARQAALAAALDGAPFSTVRHLAEAAPAAGESSPTAPAAAPDPTALATPVSPTGAHPPDSTPNQGDSGRRSSPPPFDGSETASYTIQGASNLHPAPDPRFTAGLGNRVALRALAIHTLLQEARRRRLSALPVSALQEALLADLRTLASGPYLP